jgi:hypothetical protein
MLSMNHNITTLNLHHGSACLNGDTSQRPINKWFRLLCGSIKTKIQHANFFIQESDLLDCSLGVPFSKIKTHLIEMIFLSSQKRIQCLEANIKIDRYFSESPYPFFRTSHGHQHPTNTKLFRLSMVHSACYRSLLCSRYKRVIKFRLLFARRYHV